MDIRQITYFLAIAEERSISRAAARLHLSQPSLSSFLTKLEGSLGVKLFLRRQNKSLELTEAGEAYLESAHSILNTYNQLLDRLAELSIQAEKKLSLGFAGVRNAPTMAQVVTQLCQLHPGARIEMVERGAFELMDMIIHNELDMAYAAYDGEENLDSRLSCVSLWTTEVSLAIPLAHPLAKGGSPRIHPDMPRIRLEEIGDSPFVLLKGNTVFRQVAERYFKATGFRPNIQIEAESNNASLNIVELGSHSGLCPYGYHSDRVSFFALEPAMIYRAGIYYRKDRFLTQIMKDCIQILQEQFLP